jgi:hypothetical protein
MAGRPWGSSAPRRAPRSSVLALALLAAAAPARAQSSESTRERAPACAAEAGTRQDVIACLQAEKAGRLRPYVEPFAESVLDRVERVFGTGQGAYPWLGSVYPGGMLAIGAGYRRGVGDAGVMNALGGWSLRNYKLARIDMALPLTPRRRFIVSPYAMWLDAPSVAFYGTGPDTSPETRTTYAYSPAVAGVNGTARIGDWVTIGAGAEAQSIETNLAAGDVRYLIARAAAGADWRSSPGYSRTGGLYRVEWAHHDSRGGGPFTFRQIEAEAIQLLPLLRESSVIALRGLITTTTTDAGQAVPVFMLPSLGGGTTLRGYPSWRFRDRHRLLLSGEYRWMASQVIDMAIFVDAGMVAPRRDDLRLRALKTDAGIGIRLHGPTFTALRLDVARGREGWVVNLGGGAAF